jgi:hypothetical protein
MFKTAMSTRSFKQFINDKGSPCKQLRDKASELEKLNQKLAAFLPSPLNKHCRVANLRQDVVVLNVNSAAWSARIRFMTPAILSYLRDKCSLQYLKSVRIRVSMPDTKNSVRDNRPAAISKKSAAGLKEYADTLSDDGLREVMRKLASHAGD